MNTILTNLNQTKPSFVPLFPHTVCWDTDILTSCKRKKEEAVRVLSDYATSKSMPKSCMTDYMQLVKSKKFGTANGIKVYVSMPGSF